MKKIILTSLIVFTFTGFIYSQNDNTLFKSHFRMTGAWSGVGTAFTKMADQTVGQFETSTILEYNNTLLLGYEWRSNLNELKILTPLEERTFKFGYNTFLIGYNCKTDKIIHPKFTVGVGSGNLIVNEDKEKVLVFHTSAGIEINLLQWARLSIEGGYRHVSNIETIGLETSDLSNFSGSVILRFGWSWE